MAVQLVGILDGQTEGMVEMWSIWPLLLSMAVFPDEIQVEAVVDDHHRVSWVDDVLSLLCHLVVDIRHSMSHNHSWWE
jgi:hypothetical protein